MLVFLKDGRGMKLGRKSPQNILLFDDRVVIVDAKGVQRQCVRLDRFYDPQADVNPPPEKVDWAAKAMASISRVYLNDRYGDCVVAGKYHQIGIWSGNDTSQVALATDNEVLNSYHTICGPGDNGCVITEVLDYFRDHGLLTNAKLHKIDGYVAVDNTNKTLVQVAIDLFGGLTLGIDLPADWTCTNCVWDVTRSQIVGGHDVCVCGYDTKGVQICTWGGIVTITWAAFLSRNWIQESYAELSPDWYNEDALAPNGINVSQLKAAMAAIGGGTIPPIDPPGPLPPVPPIPPPPAPPSTFVVNVPQQPVLGAWGMHIGHVPAFSVTGTIESKNTANQMHLRPWLLQMVREAAAQPALGASPWSCVFWYLSRQLPPPNTLNDVNGATLTLPPWLLVMIRMACAEAESLPAPYAQIAQAVCAMLPASANPCGCK